MRSGGLHCVWSPPSVPQHDRTTHGRRPHNRILCGRLVCVVVRSAFSITATGQHGHHWAEIRASGRRPVVCPIVLTMEWATTGKNTGQHGLMSMPFACCSALVYYVDGTQHLYLY